MRKFLSFITVFLFAGSLLAKEVTVDYSTKGYKNQTVLDGEVVKSSDVSITLAKGAGSVAPAYYSVGTGVRVYSDNTITVSAETSITKITFNFTQNSKNFDVNKGVYSKNKATWTGSARSVVFTAVSGSGHNRIQSISITYNEVDDETIITIIKDH